MELVIKIDMGNCFKCFLDEEIWKPLSSGSVAAMFLSVSSTPVVPNSTPTSQSVSKCVHIN